MRLREGIGEVLFFFKFVVVDRLLKQEIFGEESTDFLVKLRNDVLHTFVEFDLFKKFFLVIVCEFNLIVDFLSQSYDFMFKLGDFCLFLCNGFAIT